MTIRTKSIPNAAISDLVESYQHRALSLEIELRQMSRDGSLGASAYQKRVTLLRRLKTSIAGLHQHLRQPGHTDLPGRFMEDLPAPHTCTPAEELLCLRYLDEVERFIRSLHADTQDVITWVQKVLKGRLISILTTFDLSRLRSKLVRREDQITEFQQDQTQWHSFINTVLKALTRKPQERGRQAMPALKQLFYQLDDLGTDIISLRLRMEKEEEELNWMEHWLSFQELRFTQRHYLSYLEPPRPTRAPPPARRPKAARRKR